MSRRTSAIWKYFIDDGDGFIAHCRICVQGISYKTSTTNLKTHLKRKHIHAYNNVMKENRNLDSSMKKIRHVSEVSEPEFAISDLQEQLTDTESTPAETGVYNDTTQRRSRRSSFIWKFYRDDRSKNRVAECMLCGSRMSYKTTTSNLKLHMKRKHQRAYATTLTEQKYIAKRKRSFVASSELNVKSYQLEEADEAVQPISFVEIPTATPSSPLMSNKNKKTITSKISYNSIEKTWRDNELIDEALLSLFIWDFHSFNIVEDKGFLRYTHSLNPSYNPPDKKTISMALIPSVYAKCHKKMMEEVKREALSVCVTTDTWTSSPNDVYIAITIHYTKKDTLEMKSVLLDCIHITEKDTVEELMQKLKTTVNNWGLTDKVLLAITDNSSIIVNAVNLLGWNHFGCYALNFNLCVDEALKVVSETLEKVKNVVSFFKKSPTAFDILLKYQIQQQVSTPKKLKQSVNTRWNSIYYMLQRIVELEQPVRATLALMGKEFDDDLTCDDWTVCIELCTVLQPFEEVIAKMSSENYTSGSMSIVLTRGLQRLCLNLLNKEYSPIVKKVILKLQEGLSARFDNIEFHEVLAMCTFLDPRFKIHGFSDELAANAMKKRAQDLIMENMATKTNPNNMVTSEKIPRSNNFSVWDDFDTLVKEIGSTGTSLSRATKEVVCYLEEELLPRSESPIDWWKVNRHIFPNLADLFIKQGNVIATSVPCERIFSKAGYIINKRRTRLTAEKIKQLIFLNANYRL